MTILVGEGEAGDVAALGELVHVNRLQRETNNRSESDRARNRIVTGADRKRHVGSIRGRVVLLQHRAERHDAIDVVVERTKRSNHVEPERPKRRGGVAAHRELVLRKTAALAEGCFLCSCRYGHSVQNAAARHGVDASRHLRRRRAFTDETHRLVDLQPRHITGRPDVEAERPTRTLRDRDLVLDQINGGGTALHGILGEQRDLAWRNDKAVFVICHDQLTLGREVPRRVSEQVRLIRIRLNERDLAGGAEQRSGVDVGVGRDGASWIFGVGEAKGQRVVYDRLLQAVEIGWDKIDTGRRQSVPKRFPIRCAQAYWIPGQVRNDDVASACSFELHDSRDLILGGLGHIGNPLVSEKVAKREVDVVAARADQIERVRVRDATVRGQIIVDLFDGGHSRKKKAVALVIHVVVTSAAGCIVGAATAGIIGRNGGGAKKAREQLARHQAWAGRCTPGTLLDRAREQGIEVRAAAREWLTVLEVVAVPARVDAAVTKPNELVDGLCSSRTRNDKSGSKRQKTQYITHATPPAISLSTSD